MWYIASIWVWIIRFYIISFSVWRENEYDRYEKNPIFPVSVSDIAASLENSEKIEAEQQKLSKDVKVKENKKISFYSDNHN